MGFWRLWAPRALALSLALVFSADALAYVVYIDCDPPDSLAEPVPIVKPIAPASHHHVIGHRRRSPHRPSHRVVIYKCRLTHRCRELGWMDPGDVPYFDDGGGAEGVTIAYWDGAGAAALDPTAVPEPTKWILLILGFGAIAMRRCVRMSRPCSPRDWGSGVSGEASSSQASL